MSVRHIDFKISNPSSHEILVVILSLILRGRPTSTVLGSFENVTSVDFFSRHQLRELVSIVIKNMCALGFGFFIIWHHWIKELLSAFARNVQTKWKFLFLRTLQFSWCQLFEKVINCTRILSTKSFLSVIFTGAIFDDVQKFIEFYHFRAIFVDQLYNLLDLLPIVN